MRSKVSSFISHIFEEILNMYKRYEIINFFLNFFKSLFNYNINLSKKYIHYLLLPNFFSFKKKRKFYFIFCFSSYLNTTLNHFQLITFILHDLTKSGAFSRFLILRFRETTEYDRVWIQNVKWPTLSLASVFLDRREGWRLFRRQASRENNFDLFSRIRKLGSLHCDSMRLTRHALDTIYRYSESWLANYSDASISIFRFIVLFR